MFKRILVALPCFVALACSADKSSSDASDTERTDSVEEAEADSPAQDSDAGDTGDAGETASLSAADLVGQWESPVCEAYDDGAGGTNYLTRDFTLSASSWNLVFTVFGDEGCTYPLFSGEIDGPYTLTGPSTSVSGAVEGEFGFEQVAWTAHDPGIADFLTSSSCGAEAWEVGVAQDVSETGCIGVAHPVAECPAEYDLVALEDGQLFFGERITNMCAPEGRPAALVAYGLESAG